MLATMSATVEPAAAEPATAEPRTVMGRLDRAAIGAALFGVTLDGEYSDGLAFSERFNADMTSVYEQQGVTSRGAMRFEPGAGAAGGDLLCFSYEGDDLSGGCFEVWRRSANCFDFYGAGDDGVADATPTQRRIGTGWTARAWRADRASTCVAEGVA